MKILRYSALGAFVLIMPFLFVQITHEVSPIPIDKVKRTSDRGIYVTYWVAKTPARFERLLTEAKACGINTLVIDAKEALSRPLLEMAKNHTLSPDAKFTAEASLLQMTNKLHDEGFIVTARLVTFKDDHLVIARPDLGVKLNGGLYRDRKGGKWADPYSEEVRLYNELIAERAAQSGFDEVQFDYIRFPAEGGALSATYSFEEEGVSKVDAICLFLESVKNRLEPYKTSIAVDIFGVTAWQSKEDIKNLGQDVKRMAKYIDVLSPMLYPSHFHNGYDGYDNPGSYPYYFMNSGVRKTLEILSGEAVSVIPWLQGFDMKSPNFGPNYILEQVKACKDEKVEKFLIWNARNVYDVSFSALRNR